MKKNRNYKRAELVAKYGEDIVSSAEAAWSNSYGPLYTKVYLSHKFEMLCLSVNFFKYNNTYKIMKQVDLNQVELPFPGLKTGSQLRDEGIQKALDNAEHHYAGWLKDALQFLIKAIKDMNYDFQMEQIRESSLGILPEPPHNRAWGGVAQAAQKAGLIIKVGYREVKNPQAHKAIATVWRRKI